MAPIIAATQPRYLHHQATQGPRRVWIEEKKGKSMAERSLGPPQRWQRRRARQARSWWERPWQEAKRPVVVERRAAPARMSLGWEEKCGERFAKAEMRGVERPVCGSEEVGIEERRRVVW
jgi:hypothetical protein